MTLETFDLYPEMGAGPWPDHTSFHDKYGQTIRINDVYGVVESVGRAHDGSKLTITLRVTDDRCQALHNPGPPAFVSRCVQKFGEGIHHPDHHHDIYGNQWPVDKSGEYAELRAAMIEMFNMPPNVHYKKIIMLMARAAIVLRAAPCTCNSETNPCYRCSALGELFGKKVEW